MTQPFRKPAPVREQFIDPLPAPEVQRLAAQAELLRMAEAGDEEALRWVRQRLCYWWRLGEEIVG